MPKRKAHGREGWRRRLSAEAGQVLSEYLSVLGFMVVTVAACMAAFISPVAAAYARLFKRLVLYFTST